MDGKRFVQIQKLMNCLVIHNLVRDSLRITHLHCLNCLKILRLKPLSLFLETMRLENEDSVKDSYVIPESYYERIRDFNWQGVFLILHNIFV